MPSTTDTTAPDLENGVIINGSAGVNNWSTEIQCALTERTEAGEERSYLGHECRYENVPYGEPDGGAANPRIVKEETPFEFVTFSKAGRFHQLGSIDTVVDRSLFERMPATRVGDFWVSSPVSDESWASRVICRERAIEILDPEAVFHGLRDGGLSPRRLYANVAVRLEGGGDWEVHFPCRYINFPGAEMACPTYLQAMSGHVLVPAYGSYAHGYMACAVNGGGESRIEFVTSRYFSLFQRLADGAGDGGGLARLDEAVPLIARTTDLVGALPGRLSFFVYAD